LKRCFVFCIACALLLSACRHERAGAVREPIAEPLLGDNGSPLMLNFDKSRPLQQDCYGANVQLSYGPLWFDHPDVAGKYLEAGRPFFRFPGGTLANFYNPETGLFDEEARTRHDLKALNRRIREMQGGGGKLPAGFFAFARQTGARYSVVLNVSTLTLEQNRDWLTRLAAQGIDVPAFEIGNELYFNSYAWAIETPASYVERARQYTSMLREVFPAAKVGVIVPSYIYTHEVFLEGHQPNLPGRQKQWMELLEKESFFDAVIIHLYSSMGMKHDVKKEELLPFAQSYANAVNYAERNLDKSLDLLETKFPGKEIWITEYGVGGFRGAARQYRLRNAHLGCLHNDLLLLRFLSRPSVTMTHWHSFSQCITFDHEHGGIHKEPTLQFEHLTLFADAVRHSRDFVPVSFGTDVPGIEAAAFSGDNTVWVMVLNKGADACLLSGLTSLQPARLAAAVQLAPKSGLPLAEALESDTAMERTVLRGAGLDRIEFPGYSITRLEFEWTKGTSVEQQKRRTGTMKAGILAAAVIAVGAQAGTVEEWNFKNGSPKSEQGTSLGMRWRDDAQAESGIMKAAYKLTPKEAFFSRLAPLAKPIDCTKRPVVRLEIEFSAVDFSANPSANTHFLFKLADSKSEKDAGLMIRDFFKQDAIHANVFHNLGGKFAFENSGRLVDSLGPDNTSHTVVLELDFKKNEARVSTTPAWIWSPKGKKGTVVHTLDLSGIKTIDALQSGFRDLTAGDTITVEHIKISSQP
jgi:hypothetical protein